MGQFIYKRTSGPTKSVSINNNETKELIVSLQ